MLNTIAPGPLVFWPGVSSRLFRTDLAPAARCQLPMAGIQKRQHWLCHVELNQTQFWLWEIVLKF